MITASHRFLLVVGLALGAVACGSSSSSSTPAAAASSSTVSSQASSAAAASASTGSALSSSTTSAQAPSSTTAAASSAASPIAMRATSLGTVLTNPQGLTLYYLKPERGTHVACTGGCASTWPPLLVTTAGALSLPAGVGGTLSTVTRPDGTIQATYDSWPLYRFASDSAPGSVRGEGIGGVWFVVKPGLAP